MNRKDFIVTACGACGLAAVSGFFEGCKKSDENAGPAANFTIDLNSQDYTALNTVGGYVYKDGVMIFRLSQTEYIALSQKCTHQGCTVAFNKSNVKVECPCHGSTFDTNGKVTHGPADTALKKYTVTLNNNQLTVKG